MMGAVDTYLFVGFIFSIVFWTSMAVRFRKDIWDWLLSFAKGYRDDKLSYGTADLIIFVLLLCFVPPLVVSVTTIIYPAFVVGGLLHLILMWISAPKPESELTDPTLDELKARYPEAFKDPE